MPKASYALGPPAGFPRCGECIYFNNGSADICFTCAGAAVTSVSATACPVCSQYLEPDTSCSNRLCRSPSRRISRIQAIAMYADPLKYPIWALKDGKRGWGTIFGRMLLGWLDATNPNVDLIIALPTFYRSPPVEGSRPYPHTEAVISAASNEDLLGRWPFDVTDPRLVTQTAPSPKSAGGDWSAKHAAAQAKREVWQLDEP